MEFELKRESIPQSAWATRSRDLRLLTVANSKGPVRMGEIDPATERDEVGARRVGREGKCLYG